MCNDFQILTLLVKFVLDKKGRCLFVELFEDWFPTFRANAIFLKLGVSFWFCFSFFFVFLYFCWLPLSSKISISSRVKKCSSKNKKKTKKRKKFKTLAGFEPLTSPLPDQCLYQLSYQNLILCFWSIWKYVLIMASKNEALAASSQYMLEVHMSTNYHKGSISLAQSSPLYSHRNEIMKILKKAMAPFSVKLKHFH